MREEARSADEVLQVDWFLRFPAALESRFRDYFVLRSLPVVRFAVPLLLLFYLTAVMFEYIHLPALVRHYWLPHLVIFLEARRDKSASSAR